MGALPVHRCAWGKEPQLDPQPDQQTPLEELPADFLPNADSVGSADEVTRLVLVSDSNADLERGPTPTGVRDSQATPTSDPRSLDPAVTPSGPTGTVTLLPEAPNPVSAFGFRSRYTNESDLSIASTSYDLTGRGDFSDDEDDLDSLFTLHAWKRYYGYNKNKHQDLLKYFWRRFPPRDYSCFCISYRDQDLLLTAYMAENCVNGFVARIEDLGLADGLFLQLYTLHDFKSDQYRIVGLLVVQGQSLPPQLAALSAFDGFVYHKADVGVTLVKQFVSALLVGKSPLNSLQLLSGREVV
ncbi:hypothetical protein GPECTOR_30g154 [Gonium pectorale]|uniref:EF-1-gamma C-terminal domain-containing protein n=1 Tax=Gonium pectorale TaxID=33097 RepID=A0A150GDZ4_GONPE|nr:hypothetical protein GPECTOR_30g154 [Gonium pectorale]|eukprot:KXZ48059.1 hypothetical protein GPECTOR_30g154 [Gonium pectorale]